MLKTTTIPLLALGFAGILTLAEAAAPAAEATVSGPAAMGASPRLAQATQDSGRAAVKPKKAKASASGFESAQTVKDTTAPAVSATQPTAAAPATPSAPSAAAPAADSARTSLPAAPDSARTIAAPDSAKAPAADSAPGTPVPAPATAGIDSSADTAEARPTSKKRKRVVRETTVNTIDELKGKYRSPKKALFMSMVVPGLGQAYVGQHWSNYARGAVYFMADVALAYGWHHYVVTRQNAQIRKYQAFADTAWSQWRYEDSTAAHWDAEKRETRFPNRVPYCDAVQNKESSTGNALYVACKDPGSADYASFKNQYDDRNLPQDSIARRRDNFANPHGFYELIGKEPEFLFGWADAANIYTTDSAFYAKGPDGGALIGADNRPVQATSPYQQRYIDMRDQANSYARMQAYFLGGMVVNHLISALDAALAANYHNKSLYQTETNWWDRLRLDSRLAWDGYAPTPTVTASLTF